MKRVLGHCLAGLTLLCGGVAVMSACAHDDSSLFVQNALYPTPVSVGQSCVYTADPNQTFLPSGELDLAFASEYSAWFLIGDQMVAQANGQQLETETSTVDIQGAIVVDTDAAGNQLDSFRSVTSGTVYPSSGTVPGYVSTSATIASQKAVSALASEEASNIEGGGYTTLITYVKFYGYTLGGTYIESNNFEFPITVCNGKFNPNCLIDFSQSEVTSCCVNGTCATPAPMRPNCLGASSTAASLPVPCIRGQDTKVQCSQCQDNPACSGAYATTAPPSLCLMDGGTGG
jgi:hypothetical protein